MVWTPAAYADGVVTVLVAGPNADPSSAIVVSDEAAESWIRMVDTPEAGAAFVSRIDIT